MTFFCRMNGMKPGCSRHCSLSWPSGVSCCSATTISSWYTDSIVPVCVPWLKNWQQAAGSTCSQLAAWNGCYRTTSVIALPEVGTPKGEPAIALSDPSLPMASAATSLVVASVTYKAVESAETASAEGPRPPVAKGEPVAWPSAPELASIT